MSHEPIVEYDDEVNFPGMIAIESSHAVSDKLFSDDLTSDHHNTHGSRSYHSSDVLKVRSIKPAYANIPPPPETVKELYSQILAKDNINSTNVLTSQSAGAISRQETISRFQFNKHIDNHTRLNDPFFQGNSRSANYLKMPLISHDKYLLDSHKQESRRPLSREELSSSRLSSYKVQQESHSTHGERDLPFSLEPITEKLSYAMLDALFVREIKKGQLSESFSKELHNSIFASKSQPLIREEYAGKRLNYNLPSNAIENMRRSSVFITFYELSSGFVKKNSEILLGKSIEGVYHTGVIVFGLEFYFEGGISYALPYCTRFGKPTMVMPIGETSYHYRDVQAWIHSRSIDTFSLAEYDVAEKNCHYFTRDIIHFLMKCDNLRAPGGVEAQKNVEKSIESNIFLGFSSNDVSHVNMSANELLKPSENASLEKRKTKDLVILDTPINGCLIPSFIFLSTRDFIESPPGKYLIPFFRRFTGGVQYLLLYRITQHFSQLKQIEEFSDEVVKNANVQYRPPAMVIGFSHDNSVGIFTVLMRLIQMAEEIPTWSEGLEEELLPSCIENSDRSSRYLGLDKKKAILEAAISGAKYFSMGYSFLSAIEIAALVIVLKVVLAYYPLQQCEVCFDAWRLMALYQPLQLALIHDTFLKRILKATALGFLRLPPKIRLSFIRVLCNYGTTEFGSSFLISPDYINLFVQVFGISLTTQSPAVQHAGAALGVNLTVLYYMIRIQMTDQKFILRHNDPVYRCAMIALLLLSGEIIQKKSVLEEDSIIHLLFQIIWHFAITSKCALKMYREISIRPNFEVLKTKVTSDEAKALLCLLYHLEKIDL